MVRSSAKSCLGKPIIALARDRRARRHLRYDRWALDLVFLGSGYTLFGSTAYSHQYVER